MTEEEIDEPYNAFMDHVKITSGKEFISIGEIDVIIRAKGGHLFELLRRGILIQHQTKLSYFKVDY
jgi:hypothetical protein